MKRMSQLIKNEKAKEGINQNSPTPQEAIQDHSDNIYLFTSLCHQATKVHEHAASQATQMDNQNLAMYHGGRASAFRDAMVWLEKIPQLKHDVICADCNEEENDNNTTFPM